MKAIFVLISLIVTLGVSANQLKNHSSPYLSLHGSDPVDWMEWGKPALEKAKKENKILFVSIGYFACHWCHVMQKESYADKGIAKQLNKNYISIKVDRELNPVLDKRLIEFVQLTNGTAGWPLNVFLTPDGYPLVGATYMPRDHFSNVLDKLDDKWSDEEESLRAQALDMSNTFNAMLEKQEQPTKNKTVKELAATFVDVALENADTLQGGFGQQQKFPQLPQLWAMLKLNKQKQSKEADEFINLTLEQMSQNGLHDELAGGFYRYTIDPDWETPHFEKMLYTNAMMPLVYFDAAEQYNNPKYRQIAQETLTFLTNEMRGNKNAFIASLSAVDDKSEEGGYYLWQQNELEKVLSPEEFKIANLYWNMDRANELPAGNLPRQNKSISELATLLKISSLEAENKISSLKNKLREHRNKTRVIPRDTKLLAGMNGLTLAAFSRGLTYDRELKPTGKNLAEFLISLWDGKTLRRSAANSKGGTLYDYAAVSWGLLKWGTISNDSQAISVAKAIAATAWKRLHINDSWLETSNSLLPPGVKQTHLADSALFSAEALLLETSLNSQDPYLTSQANTVLNKVTRSLETDVYSFASFLSLQ